MSASRLPLLVIPSFTSAQLASSSPFFLSHTPVCLSSVPPCRRSQPLLARPSSMPACLTLSSSPSPPFPILPTPVLLTPGLVLTLSRLPSCPYLSYLCYLYLSLPSLLSYLPFPPFPDLTLPSLLPTPVLRFTSYLPSFTPAFLVSSSCPFPSTSRLTTPRLPRLFSYIFALPFERLLE